MSKSQYIPYERHNRLLYAIFRYKKITMLMSQQVHWFSQMIMYISKAKTYFLQYQMDEVCIYCSSCFCHTFSNTMHSYFKVKVKETFLEWGPSTPTLRQLIDVGQSLCRAGIGQHHKIRHKGCFHIVLKAQLGKSEVVVLFYPKLTLS